MDLETERALIKKAKNNPDYFVQLYEHYYPRIFNYILRRTANLQAAQDITSEVFLKAFKHRGRFRWQGVSFAAWLYRLANNQIADYFRKGSHKTVFLEEMPDSFKAADSREEIIRAEEELKRHRDFLKIQKLIGQLPLKYQEVIVLRFFERKKIKSIAEILHKKENTVKALLYRGLRKLGQRIKD